MAYTSQFTGEQMDAAFRRITNIVVGSAEITPSNNGYGYAHVQNLTTGMLNPKVFTSIRGITMDIRGVVTISCDYNPEAELLFLQIFGDGVKGGDKYEVSYMLVE